MDIAVRYIPTSVTAVQGKEVAGGNKPALCFVHAQGKEGLCVINDELAVHMIRLPRDLVLSSKPVKGYDDPEGPSKFVSYIKTVVSKEKGVSGEAYRLLDFALKPQADFPTEPENPPATKPEGKPKKAKAKKEKAEKKPKDEKPSVIGELAKEFDQDPTLIRKVLRKAGEKSPYEDAAKLRKILKKEFK